jgi:hypothetical protein
MNRRLVERSRPAPFRPQVDGLEDRLTPAVLVSQAAGSNLLLIHATGRRDTIQIVDRGDNRAGAVRVSGTGLAAFESAVLPSRAKAVIDIFAARATTRVDYFARGTQVQANPRTVVVNLGPLTGLFHRVKARQVTTGAGEQVRVMVNRASSAAALTLTVHGTSSRPVMIRSPAGNNASAQQGAAPLPGSRGESGTGSSFNVSLPNTFSTGSLAMVSPMFSNSFFGNSTMLGMPMFTPVPGSFMIGTTTGFAGFGTMGFAGLGFNGFGFSSGG